MIIARCPLCGKEAKTYQLVQNGEYFVHCQWQCPMNDIDALRTVEEWNAFGGWFVRPADGWGEDDLPKYGEPCIVVWNNTTQFAMYYYNGHVFISCTDPGEEDYKIKAEEIDAYKPACKPPEVKA